MLNANIMMGFEGTGDSNKYFTILQGILSDRFSDDFNFTEIRVEPLTDHDGEDYLHTYIVFEGDWRKLDPGKTLGISTILWPEAIRMGYEAIPIQSFVEKSEWMAMHR